MQISKISFLGEPKNYSKIDSILSRSAQPQREDFMWLKSQGVTDIVNFRTMVVSGVNFDEKEICDSLQIRYHNIPSVTKNPTKENVEEFLKLTKQVSTNKGKLHIHCKAGADRTGMYAFIYKTLKNIGTKRENIQEWINRGHNTTMYPKLISKTIQILKQITL